MSINRSRAGAFLIGVAIVGLALAADPAAADKKAPIPDAAAQKAAAKRIKEHHAADFDKAESPAERSALAKSLISEAASAKAGAAERFTLLQIARDMAAGAADADTAFAAIEAAGDSFELDVLQSKADVLEKIANSPDSAEEQAALARRAAALGDQAVKADRYDVAKLCASVELGAAHHAGDASLLEKAGTRVEEFDELQTAFDKLKDARAALQKNPKDRAANLAIGKFRCFAKGDWTGGLPLLVLGDDAKLKTLATLEISQPKLAAEQVNLADGWWGVAQTETPRRHILELAVYWYTNALPQLKDPELTRVDKRLEEMGSIGGIGSSGKASDFSVINEIGKNGNAFGFRGQDVRKQLLDKTGGSKQSERAVAAALWWFAHHQMKEGNWSIKDYVQMCKDKSCTGPGTEETLTAATAMGVLPFLAAGQTHRSNGPFKLNVSLGIYWLISHQQANGDLYTGGVAKNDQPQPHCWMYSHAMATMALCECYGMSSDKTVGEHAQSAINFIEKAQNQTTGGWRYSPGDEGDTSVVGWELMAMKTGQMAGLKVDPKALAGAEKWLQSVAVAGQQGTSGFTYQPAGAAMETMTAVGVLCKQYMHAGRSDPAIVGGIHFLMDHQPDLQNSRNIYYWYYATQALHNMANNNWDTWNRKMRDILVKTQAREGCAAGSWDPDKPTRDAWGQYGGRLMMTSLSALTLEIYYRYPPLYVLKDAAPKPVAAPGGK